MSATLKSQNFKWLGMLAVSDAFLILCFGRVGIGELTTASALAIARLAGAALLPVAALLLVELLPTNAKIFLVYWRVRDALPGCKAFTVHGPSDPRIDMTALAKNIGTLPAEPAEQNTRWYRLYKMVDSEPAVLDANKSYLLYRDIAATSALLVLFTPLGFMACGLPMRAGLLCSSAFAIQFLLGKISGTNSGNRLVRNVLALHSAKKVED